MSCKHLDTVDVFSESAICLDCGAALCRHCHRETGRPQLKSDEICNVFFWKYAIETNTWYGKALSRNDAYNSLNGAMLVCNYVGLQRLKHAAQDATRQPRAS